MLYLIGPVLLVHSGHTRAQLVATLRDCGVLACNRRDSQLGSVIFGGKTAGSTLLLGCIVLWLWREFITLHIFRTMCLVGCVFFQIAESCQNEYALQCLCESSELFARAIEAQRIIVIRRRDAHEL